MDELDRPDSVRSDPSPNDTFERIDSSILISFPDLVAALGGDTLSMLRHVGIDPSGMASGQWTVSYPQMAELLALAARQLNCSDFGMRLAKLQAGAIRSPLFEIFRNSPILGEALGHVIEHSYAHSLAASIWVRPVPEDETSDDPADGMVRIGHDILVAGIVDRRQAIEQILLIEYLTCLDATGGMARARRVEFRHQAISAPAVYRSHFGCEVRFEQPVDAIVFSGPALRCPIVAPDQTARLQVIERIDSAFADRETPLHARVRSLVMHLLGSEECTNEEIATQLKLHPRTLHRRLRQEGTSFQRIKNQVRLDLMVHYLDQADTPVAAISERLGFAEQAALTRFCRQRLGVSPMQRRASQHG